MSTEAKVKVKITGDASGARAEFGSLSGAATSSARTIAQAYASVAVAVRTATSAVNTFKSALGIFQLVATALASAVSLAQKAYSAFRNLGRATGEAMESAQKFAERAKDSGLDASLYDAVRAAAAAAGMSADELSEKLRAFKEHRATFEELAAAVGKTGESLKEAAGKSDRAFVGRRFLAAEKARADADAAEEELYGNEAAGRRAIVARIVRSSTNGNGADAAGAWDAVMEWARGDAGRARSFFDANNPWWSFRSLGVMGFGERGLEEAAARYAGRQAARDAARRAEIAAADAATAKAREAEAAKAAARAAEEKAKADERAAQEAAREAESARRAREAAEERAARVNRARERNRAQFDEGFDAALKAREEAWSAVRVSAPAGASSFASSGGLLGGDFAARNAERMDRERNERLASIESKFAETVDKLTRHYREVEESLSE